MSFELVMPRAGLTMVEGTIATWLAAEGSEVKKGDAIMEFENEKNTIEFACTHDGILHITAPEGETVAVGAPIGMVAESRAEYDALCGGSAPAAPAAEATPASVEAPAAAPVAAPAAPAPAVADSGRVRATGLAKKMAKQKGVALSAVKGTGPNGRIIAQDILDYLEAQKNAPAASAAAAAAPDDVVTEIQMTGIRKAIAKNMYNSLQDMAQCTAAVEVDVTELLAYRQKLVENQEYLGCKVTVNDLLAMATVKMLQKHPAANATFDGKILSVHSAVNLSVAVAAEVGLMVPVVKNAERMSLVQLHTP